MPDNSQMDDTDAKGTPVQNLHGHSAYPNWQEPEQDGFGWQRTDPDGQTNATPEDNGIAVYRTGGDLTSQFKDWPEIRGTK